MLTALRAHYGDSPAPMESFEDYITRFDAERRPPKKPWRWWEDVVPESERMTCWEPSPREILNAKKRMQVELWGAMLSGSAVLEQRVSGDQQENEYGVG